LALALTPPRLLSGWTAEVAGLATLPLVPIQHGGRVAARWLRPSLSEIARERRSLESLARERDEARALYRRLELENERLEREIEMLAAVAARVPGSAVRAIRATVVAATRPGPRSPAGTLRINVGARHGVDAGLAAIRDGDAIVGRIVDPPGALSGTITPVGGVGPMEVLFLPPDDDRPAAEAIRGILKPDGRGGFVADLGRAEGVGPGWVARLADERWPRGAWGLRVATVTATRPLDTSPLHTRVELVPAVEPLASLEVILIGDPREPRIAEGAER